MSRASSRIEVATLCGFGFAVAERSNFGLRLRGVCLRRWFERELTRPPSYFSPQCLQLLRQLAVVWGVLFIECFPGLRNRHHQRHRPASKRSHNKFHRVNSLQALYTTRGTDQTDYFVSEVRGLAVAEQLQPTSVEKVGGY